MYKIRLTAETLNDLRDQVATLAVELGFTVAVQYDVLVRGEVDVPLPPPRVEPERTALATMEGPRQKRKYTRRQPVDPNPEPETQMHAAAEPESESGKHIVAESDDIQPLNLPDASLTEGVEPMQDDGPEFEGETDPRALEADDAEERFDVRPTQPEGPTETDGAQPAEPEPVSSETATPASDDGASPEADYGPSAPQVNAWVKTPEGETYTQAIDAARDFGQAMVAVREFINTDCFKWLTPDEQNGVRRTTWGVLVAKQRDGEIQLPDHASDPQAFRLWIEAQDDADAIRGTKTVLDNSEMWGVIKNAERAREVIDVATKARLERLGA